MSVWSLRITRKSAAGAVSESPEIERRGIAFAFLRIRRETLLGAGIGRDGLEQTRLGRTTTPN